MTDFPLVGKKLTATSDTKNISKLIDFIIEEVLSAGGDGDCLVICKNYDAFNIKDLFLAKYKKNLESFNITITKDSIQEYYKGEHTITIGDGQDSWIFTNDLNFQYPSWMQCVIII